MEARRITIVSTREQKKYVILTEAETLGQLKADMRTNGIDYADMAFMEGLSKTELLSDDSYLPTNVARTNRETGETTTTNELVFMLTNANKKIKSGMNRKEAYEYIKAHNLQDAVKDAYGRNFTQVSTAELETVIVGDNHCDVCCTNDYIAAAEEMGNGRLKAINAIIGVAEVMKDSLLILNDELDAIRNIFFGKETNNIESPYTDDELTDILGELC